MHQLQLPARDRLHQSAAAVPVVPQRALAEDSAGDHDDDPHPDNPDNWLS